MKKNKSLLIVSLLLAALFCFATGCFSKKDSYTVTFDANGGTAIESVEIVDGSTVAKPTDPTKEGYTFAGWFLGEEEFSFEQEIKGAITLTAKWAPKTDTAYTVKHFQEKLDGGYEEIVADAESLQGTTDALTNATAKSYTGFTAQEIVQKTIAPNGSTVVEVKYNRNLIAITWVVEGESTQENYKYGAIPTRANPVKAADETYTYTFSNWDSELVAATETKTYTAVFSSSYVNYSVVFKGENGEEIARKDDYHYGDTIVAPAAPVKESDNVYSYTFNGWNNAETVTGNAEYQATFTPQYINYSVVFETENGEEIARKDDYHYGDVVVVPDHSENLPGYTYGWDKEIVAVNGNATYVETKEPKTYNVTLVANGGEVETELTSYVYSVGATLPNASKLGHTFKGWYLEEDFSGEAVTAISVTDLDDKTYYAKWEANRYNVTLNPGSGNVESELTSYVYGVGAVLPNATKKGYTLDGWYAEEDFSGEKVAEISVTDLGDKTFYAKYTPNKDTKYSVKVLVPQYAVQSSGGYYSLGAVTYVDKTSEYASFFSLNENNQAQGETDSTVNLTSLINTLQGAKLNEDSIVSGVINADETLALTVKLDLDEDELGFKLSNICLGQWSWENIAFSLGYMDGVCGLAITGTLTAFRKEVIISMDPVNVTKYANYSLVYYEKGADTQNKFLVNDLADTINKTYVSATSDKYVRYSLNVHTLFPDEKVVNKVRLSLYGKTTKELFIKGIEAPVFVKEDVTYSIANDNLMDIAKPLGAGKVSQVENYSFKNNGESIDMDVPALLYSYSGEAVMGKSATGVILNLGGIRVSDYKVIKITFQTLATVASGNNPGTDIFCGDEQITSQYGGAHVVDIKALAVANGVTSFSTLELSMSYWAPITSCSIYIASIELVVDENAPAVPDLSYNVNLELSGGELETEFSSYVYGVGATLPQASKAGHTFIGWYANSDYSGDIVTSISAEAYGNKTFFAKFEANTYNVALTLNGGLADELTSYVYGVGATLPQATKTGHTFMGWYADSEFTGEAVTAITATDLGDKAFYAKWQVNTYTVTLVTNDGTAEFELTSYVYGVGATLPNCTKDGDTFGGWYTNSGFGGDVVTEISVTDLGDKTFYAKWTANSYNVTLVLNGGVVAEGLGSYEYGVGATLPQATKTGYTFQGWYVEEDFSGEKVTEISASDMGDKTFYAKWTANTYNVTLVLNGGNSEELTSYVYGTGAVLPVASKVGYTFAGWYVNSALEGEAVAEITATDVGDKTFYAKWTPNQDTKYSVKVMVAQYGMGYTSPYHHIGDLTYVDRTSEYASFFGLDENNTLQGETDSTVDIAAKVATLVGAKVHADSKLSGVIAGDGSLELVVKLDFDEEYLGFKLDKLRIGQWGTNDNIKFTLQYYDNVCGLAIDEIIKQGKEILIEVDEMVVDDYLSIAFNYYEKLPEGCYTNFAAMSEVKEAGATTGHVSAGLTTSPNEYVHASIDVLAKFPTLTTIKQFSFKYVTETERHIFITGIEAVKLKKETVTYSIANGNLLDIATPLGQGTISQVANHTFGNSNPGEEVSLNSPALLYSYKGDAVPGTDAGIVIDLGGVIRVSDYKTIKITFQTIANNGGTNVFCANTELTCPWGGAHIVDIKALAESKNVTSFDSIEMFMSTWAQITSCEMYIASIELELND